MHPAALGVAIHIAKHEEQTGKGKCSQADDTRQRHARKKWLAPQAIVSREHRTVVRKPIKIYAEADDQCDHIQQNAHPHQPLGDYAQFIAESAAFALPPETDQSESLIKCIGHVFLSYFHGKTLVSAFAI